MEEDKRVASDQSFSGEVGVSLNQRSSGLGDEERKSIKNTF